LSSGKIAENTPDFLLLENFLDGIIPSWIEF
jgi:hypothetical protein